MEQTILQINGLSKNYGSVKALSDFSCKIEAGKTYGILGPNGSGKTTTLGIVLGVINASSGNYSWFEGSTLNKNKHRIGALLETPNFYPYLSAYKNLDVVAAIKQIANPKIDEVLHFVGLEKWRNAAFKTFSLGMKQRLAIAATLIADPEVLILDEPTNGLDPEGIADVRKLITEIRQKGKTIILASHLIDEVEKVCTDVIILKSGKTLESGSIHEVLKGDDTIEIAADDLNNLSNLLKSISIIKSFTKINDKISISLNKGNTATELNKAIFEKGIVLSHLLVKKKKLEEQFLELIK